MSRKPSFGCLQPTLNPTKSMTYDRHARPTPDKSGLADSKLSMPFAERPATQRLTMRPVPSQSTKRGSTPATANLALGWVASREPFGPLFAERAAAGDDIVWGSPSGVLREQESVRPAGAISVTEADRIAVGRGDGRRNRRPSEKVRRCETEPFRSAGAGVSIRYAIMVGRGSGSGRPRCSGSQRWAGCGAGDMKRLKLRAMQRVEEEIGSH